MGLSHSPRIVTNGLVLCLDAGNTRSYPGSGTTWTDLSGLNNTGTLTSGPTFSSVNGGAIVFDGVDDYVSITETSGMTPSVLTLEIIFEVLSDTNTIYGAAPNTEQYIAFRQNSRATDSYEAYAIVYKESSRQITLVTASAAGIYAITNATNNSTPLNTKIHLTCLLNTTQQSLYINGVLNAGPTSKSSGIDYNVGNTLKLGRYATAYDAAFNGRIYSFKLYNRVLSDAEIRQNFNATRGRYGI